MNVHQQGPRGLYYLRSIRSLDLGHCHLSAVPFVANMPHLRHLILADDLVYDISPLENLKELEWLELFNTAVGYPTPLLGCTALRDLNVCYISTPPDALFETLLADDVAAAALVHRNVHERDAQVKAPGRRSRTPRSGARPATNPPAAPGAMTRIITTCATRFTCIIWTSRATP